MSNILLGLSVVFRPDCFLALFFGVFFGLIIGALPGLTGNMAIALLVPVTFAMDPVVGLVLLAAIYCSAIFGGSISAILLGIPGTISSLATTFDGHPMAQKGLAGRALGVATISSVIGGLFSATVLMFVAPQLAEQALRFGPAEYFALAVLGLSCIASVGEGSVLKGVMAGVLGLLISTVGMSPQTGYPRFWFGNFSIIDGVPFIPALIGFFGVVSVLKMAEKAGTTSAKKVELPSIGRISPDYALVKRLIPTWFRSSVIGTIVGIIPGAGTTIATFLSYDYAKRASKTPEEFGKGIEEGVAAPESANNAVTGGSLVPLLALGVPGNSTSALLLGALMIHGLRTGPMFFQERPDVIYGLLVSLFLANIIMAPLGLFVARFMTSILAIPTSLMGGIIIAFCTVGTYAMRNNPVDIVIMVVFGLLGYLMEKVKLPSAPIILALVLGPMLERSWQQALVISRGSYDFLYARPITLVILLMSLWSFSAPIVKMLRRRKAPVAHERQSHA